MDNRPIGIFDSGFGGLTVAKELMKRLPNESLIYFGDNGRAPYGNKSVETLQKYTFQDVRFLIERDVKLLVIACNTASASSLDAIVNHFDIPVIEVIESGCKASLGILHGDKIGVIGTKATIESGVYKKKLESHNPRVTVYQKACPLFVPLVEEGWWDNPITLAVTKEYLMEFKEYELDALLLGCTHYPLLKKVISHVVGNQVQLISSDYEVAKSVEGYLKRKCVERSMELTPFYQFYTSDNVDKFRELGRVIIEKDLDFVKKVDIEKY